MGKKFELQSRAVAFLVWSDFRAVGSWHFLPQFRDERQASRQQIPGWKCGLHVLENLWWLEHQHRIHGRRTSHTSLIPRLQLFPDSRVLFSTTTAIMGFTDLVSETGLTSMCKPSCRCMPKLSPVIKANKCDSPQQLPEDTKLHCWVCAQPFTTASRLSQFPSCTMMNKIGPCLRGGLRPRQMTPRQCVLRTSDRTLKLLVPCEYSSWVYV